MKSLSYQHPLCLSPGCYLIGFHLPSLPLSLPLSLSLLGLKLGRPCLPELLSYALSPPAIGLPIRGKWKIVFFLILFFFFILFLSLWQLAIYASLMPSWWYVERPHWLLLPFFCASTHISSALFVLRLLSNFSITSIQFARFGFAALNKWPRLR